jgi:hypothetical protein
MAINLTPFLLLHLSHYKLPHFLQVKFISKIFLYLVHEMSNVQFKCNMINITLDKQFL